MPKVCKFYLAINNEESLQQSPEQIILNTEIKYVVISEISKSIGIRQSSSDKQYLVKY